MVIQDYILTMKFTLFISYRLVTLSNEVFMSICKFSIIASESLYHAIASLYQQDYKIAPTNIVLYGLSGFGLHIKDGIMIESVGQLL